MSALKRLKKSKRGKAVCEVCDEQIKVGDYYEKFSVRFSNPRTRCDKHPFRQSDMAQGKNATAYGVQEYLEDWSNGIVEKDEKPFDFEVLKVRVDGAMSDIENLAEEYEDGKFRGFFTLNSNVCRHVLNVMGKTLGSKFNIQ